MSEELTAQVIWATISSQAHHSSLKHLFCFILTITLADIDHLINITSYCIIYREDIKLNVWHNVT
jgi:hypothetical protein